MRGMGAACPSVWMWCARATLEGVTQLGHPTLLDPGLGRRWFFISGSAGKQQMMYIAKRGDNSSYGSLETWRVAGAPAQALPQGGDEERYPKGGSQEKVVRIEVRAAPEGQSQGDTEAEAQRGTPTSPKKKIRAILSRLTSAVRSHEAEGRRCGRRGSRASRA